MWQHHRPTQAPLAAAAATALSYAFGCAFSVEGDGSPEEDVLNDCPSKHVAVLALGVAGNFDVPF